jgi:hypothetical protein
MNSAQRRKFRRKWRYGISYREFQKSFDAYRIFDMADWCDRKWGAKNWKLSSKGGYVFLFDREERLTLFLLRWSE